MEFEILFSLFMVGALAGFVDTLAGGGGMLTLPALTLAGVSPDFALATNKLQGCFGTTSAAFYFFRSGKVQLKKIWRGMLTSALGSTCGVILVQIISNRLLELIIPVFLILIAIILILLPKLGDKSSQARLSVNAFLISALFPLAFYDGFLGPGTGMFIMVALVSFRGLTLQQATIETKFYNASTSLTALLMFIILSSGKILWTVGFTMAAGQLMGARIAARMILLRGNKLIYPVAILMSVVMSLVLIKRYWF